MSTPETLDHRERRLMQLGEALERHLEEGWLYYLVIARPGEPDSVNMISNVPPEEIKQIIDMLSELTRRHQAGQGPKQL